MTGPLFTCTNVTTMSNSIDWVVWTILQLYLNLNGKLIISKIQRNNEKSLTHSNKHGMESSSIKEKNAFNLY